MAQWARVVGEELEVGEVKGVMYVDEHMRRDAIWVLDDHAIVVPLQKNALKVTTDVRPVDTKAGADLNVQEKQGLDECTGNVKIEGTSSSESEEELSASESTAQVR